MVIIYSLHDKMSFQYNLSTPAGYNIKFSTDFYNQIFYVLNALHRDYYGQIGLK